MAFARYVARLIRAAHRAYSRKWSFLGAFLLVFFMSFSLLVTLDVVPEAQQAGDGRTSLLASPLVATGGTVTGAGELPIKIEIPSIDVEATIANPDTTNVAVLDRELLKGAVRYPTSARMGEEGNVILFGHSSYLPIVANKSFKAFNEIQDLEKGDRILVHGATTVYVYAVDQVVEADAGSDAIPLTVEGARLTLATCDSFGETADRFIVTATLVESYPVGS
jgi:LPXTG-site transpeptidase (sortase) family protein